MSNSTPMTANPSLATSDNHDVPASEWASNTVSALDHAEDTSHVHSVQESPGLSMPGSFPTSKQSNMPDVQYVQEVASGALKTATEYAQTAARGAQTAVQTAGEKVGEYLPTSVASYLSSEPAGTEHNSKNTVPSQETSQNYHPSTSGGVGTLPGPPGEIGVAVLPDERTGGVSVDQAARDSVASTDITKTSPIVTTSNNNGPSKRHTGYIPGVLQDDTSPGEERRLESLQHGSSLGKSTGAGTLPRSATELDGGGASTDASVRTLLGSSSTSPFGQVPQTDGREYALSRDEKKLFGGSEKKDPDMSEMDDTNKTVPMDNNAGQDTRAVGAGSGGLAGAGSAGQVASEVTAVPKEGGFMHKVKGEMKVLSGKMSHNKTKVEEGRKMMGKN